VSDISRRRFLGALATGVGSVVAARALGAQQEVPGATMDGDGYRPVRLPAKPNARPILTQADRDALEHRLSCPCPCTLDVYTCRTSMPCGFSPRLHADVVALVEGGYSADEIVAAFVNTYGEQALMEPTKQGFNAVGWLAPFAALGGGAVVIAALIRRWGRRAASSTAPLPIDVSATPEELARLEAAVREDAR
jgi:cytochrome c-type biogenesis protein CcmH